MMMIIKMWTQEGSLPLPQHTDLPQEASRASRSPALYLRALRKSRETNTELAQQIARRIRDPDYTLRMFHDDMVAAFPELTYYMIRDSKVSSGGTPADEYKRTMGAAFSFYWLMRIGIDGECGFCFGVDDQWRPNAPPPGVRRPDGTFFTRDPKQRRLAFYFDAHWAQLNQLLVDAGCLRDPRDRRTSEELEEASRRQPPPTRSLKKSHTEIFRRVSVRRDDELGSPSPGGRFAEKRISLAEKSISSVMRSSPVKLLTRSATPNVIGGARSVAGVPTVYKQPDKWAVCVERTVAMLVLTAIHDIMKIEDLLPAVLGPPYRGYLPGDTIHDHDIALAYVMETAGEELPSYFTLPPRLQKLVAFTQAKIGFNHGWLVQGEAPPAALFSQFKAEITTNGAHAPDVAFYFVHWLTDLAGAVPAPLQGSEKFVIQFPHFVLASFIRSFPVIHRLAAQTETQVLEHYLRERWAELAPKLGAVPSGEDAVALMRLVVQVQNPDEQLAVADAYGRLSEADRSTLAREMAYTGFAGQTYTASPFTILGPAILVYYSPAFLRNVAKRAPLAALQMLAVIYRGARELWPCEEQSPAAATAATAAPAAPAGAPLPESSFNKGARGLTRQGMHDRHSAQILEGTATVRIDQVKDLDVEQLIAAYEQGDKWYIARKNDLEAVVLRVAVDAVPPAELADASACRELNLVGSFTMSV